MESAERFVALAAQPFRTFSATSSGSTAGSLREILKRRELLRLLVRRDIKSRYKDSALGALWTLARPITQLAIYYVVIGQFLRAADGIPSFAIYVFTGLTAYGLFGELLGSATNSIISNAALVKKVALPREIFPLASVGSALFTFAIQVTILLAASAFLGEFPLHAGLFVGLLAAVVLIVYGTALGLLLSAVNVYLRDVGYLVEVVLMIMMWASPILYSWTMVRDAVGSGPLLELYLANPITLGVIGLQEGLWIAGDGAFPELLPLRLAIALVVGLVFLVVGHRVFARLQGNFAQQL